MTLEEIGFNYLGTCACAGRPERWVHPKRLEVKKWKTGTWKLLRGGFLVRYGSDPLSIVAEVQQYMTENNI